MQRDELICSFDTIISNIVKKYNDYKPDEDLQMIGYEECIKAVDRCIADGITNYDDIKNRVIRWVTNGIIDEKRKERNRLSVIDEDEFNEGIDSDYSLDLMELELQLTERENKALKMKLDGYTKAVIMKELGIGKSTYHNIFKKIKNLLDKSE